MAWNVERIGDFFEREILKYPESNAIKKSAVLDSSNLQSYNTTAGGRIIVPAGNVLVASGSNANQKQTLTVKGTPTGGTFKLKWNDEETAAIPYNATAEEVETALEALGNLETADVGVTLSGSVYTVEFTGAYAAAEVSLITVSDNASLTGGSDAHVEVAESVHGLAKKVKPVALTGVSSGYVGILAYTIELFGTGNAKYDEPCAMYFRDVVFDRQKLIGFSANTGITTAFPTCGFEV